MFSTEMINPNYITHCRCSVCLLAAEHRLLFSRTGIGALQVPDRRNTPEREILMETRKGAAGSCALEQITI